MRHIFTSPPLLIYPDFSQPFMLEVDASNQRLGTVLGQVDDGKLCVVAYASRGLRLPETEWLLQRAH